MEAATPDSPAGGQSTVDPLCPGCGYLLRGINRAQCPECGHDLQFLKITEPQIPWARPHDHGHALAFVQTILAVKRNKNLIWEECGRPVDPQAARRFRWVTVAITWFLLVTLAGAMVVVFPEIKDALQASVGAPSLIVSAVLGAVWLLLALAAATEVASHALYHKKLPPAIEERAVALSYYCCGPLVLAPLGLGLLLTMAIARHTHTLFDDVLLPLIGGYLLIRPVVEWLIGLHALVGRTIHDRSLLSPAMTVYVMTPASWIVAGAGMLIVPAVLGYAALMMLSLL